MRIEDRPAYHSSCPVKFPRAPMVEHDRLFTPIACGFRWTGRWHSALLEKKRELPSSLRAPIVKGRLGLAWRAGGLFQHLRNPFSHDVDDIIG